MEEKHRKHRRKRGGFLWIVLISTAVACAVAWAITSINGNIHFGNGKTFICYAKKSQIVVYTDDAEKIFMRYGHYDEIKDELEADQSSETLGHAVFSCKYNGEYTVTVRFTDGDVMTKYVKISDNKDPAVLTTENDKIFLSKNKGYRLEFVEYCYGMKLGNPYADFLYVDAGASEVQALGNGWHTFRIFATGENGEVEVYYLATQVTGCTEPVITYLDGAIGVFSYGFDIKSVTYAKGAFSSRSEIQANPDAIDIATNCTLDISAFDSGEEYTFCFREADKDYIITTIIP